MTRADRARRAAPRSRAELRSALGVLLVLREPPPALPPVPGQPAAVASDPAEGAEPLLAVWDDGSVTALHGHVDLGTGLATALGQIVAEELEVEVAAVQVVLGHTALAPNQGATIASASIQVHAEPLRRAAAQARAWLLAEAHAALTPALSRERGRGQAAGASLTSAVSRGREHAAQRNGEAPSAGASAVNPLSPAEQDRGDDADRATDAHRLLAGRHIELRLDLDARVKPPEAYRVVGQPAPRIDIPAKARGEPVFVHDMRVPGMLHGRVVRPPYAGLDAGEFVGNSLRAVDESSIAHIDGIRAVVVCRDFVGIVAEREENAERAMRELRVHWRELPASAPLDDLGAALKANPATRRVLLERGDVAAAIAGAATPLRRDYVWPYQLHASIGPSCALADWHGEAHDPALTVWAGTQNPHVLRADLARLVALPAPRIEVVRMEAAGCYGRNGADDVAADAALLARAVGAPVRVQLTREQEHLWEPKGAAQLMQIDGGLDAEGRPVACDFQTSYPSNGAPTLALLLTRTIEPVAQAYEMGDRSAVPPYAYPALRVVANDMAPILRAAWLRGVSALPNSFAHESYIDELAIAAGADPVRFRLAQLTDPRARELIEATAARAGWLPHTAPRQQAPVAPGGSGSSADGGVPRAALRPAAPAKAQAADPPAPAQASQNKVAAPLPARASAVAGTRLRGQGFAYARYVHSPFPGFGAAWAAWVADVEVDPATGEVHVARIVVGHDAGRMVNPAGVRHQIHGNVLQTTSRALKEALPLDARTHLPIAREWGAYPILTFREVPVVEVLTMPRPGEAPLGAGESASVPGTAAIANAIFDATGVRFRQPPFTPEVVRAALEAAAGAAASGSADAAGAAEPVGPAIAARRRALPAGAPWPARRAVWKRIAALGAAALGLVGAVVGRGPAPIAPIVPGENAGTYSAVTLAQGRRLAALGACVVCHTAPGGAPNAGGRALETPFGTVWSTNLTPDPATGLGAWSLAAFTRAMREGVSRAGHRLYPAFPYTAYTHATDADLTALYAYLMAQTPIASAVPETRLAFPFGVRPLLAVWNALYLAPGPIPPSADRSASWNRGAYLVDGLGHCGACHTPRNALGAERSGAAYLAGARVDGWDAPALSALSTAPRPWSEAELFAYLRRGHSAAHGSAVGPMAPVVRELGALPDADIHAMASYLASFNPPEPTAASAEALIEQGRVREASLLGPPQRMFTSACGACHHDGDGPQLLGQNIPLALNTNLHAERPDNLLRAILEGIREPATREQGFMPAFRDAFDDRQLAELAAYLRARYAPGRPPWAGLEATSARLRAAPSSP